MYLSLNGLLPPPSVVSLLAPPSLYDEKIPTFAVSSVAHARTHSTVCSDRCKTFLGSLI